MIAASLSFFACLQGLQRFGSFFSPLSWKKACSPDVQMKALVTIYAFDAAIWVFWIFGFELSQFTGLTSRSCMIVLPGSIERMIGWRGHSELFAVKEEPRFSWRVSG